MARHGSPADRGSADAYYGRPPTPHYYEGKTYGSRFIGEDGMTKEEVAQYMWAYENETDRKNWE
jgi:hypothetical protein